MLAFIGLIALVILGKFIYDTYLTNNTDRDWENFKVSEPEKAARIERNKILDFNTNPNLKDEAAKQSLLILAKRKGCTPDEAKEKFLDDLSIQNLSLEQLNAQLSLIRKNKYNESILFNIDPDDTPSAFLENWTHEFINYRHEIEQSTPKATFSGADLLAMFAPKASVVDKSVLNNKKALDVAQQVHKKKNINGKSNPVSGESLKLPTKAKLSGADLLAMYMPKATVVSSTEETPEEIMERIARENGDGSVKDVAEGSTEENVKAKAKVKFASKSIFANAPKSQPSNKEETINANAYKSILASNPEFKKVVELGVGSDIRGYLRNNKEFTYSLLEEIVEAKRVAEYNLKSPAEKYRSRAFDAYSEDNYDEAIKLIYQGLELDNKTTTSNLLSLRAECRLKLNDEVNAIADFYCAIQELDRKSSSYINDFCDLSISLFDLFLNRNMLDLARETLDKALSIVNNEKEFYFLKYRLLKKSAELHSVLGDKAKAELHTLHSKLQYVYYERWEKDNGNDLPF
ncbi:hypothetical protein WG947_15710 [Pontibacter sp. H259]|uniref:hypothetical protein n=1 Tax=Pontibacter sp. H259 TaxID=3133421 RepID=UPI0030C12F52